MAINRQKWRNKINSKLQNSKDENFKKDHKKENNVTNNLKFFHHGCNNVTITKASLANSI